MPTRAAKVAMATAGENMVRNVDEWVVEVLDILLFDSLYVKHCLAFLYN